MNSLNKGKEQIYQRLNSIHEHGNPTDDQELNLLLDSLRVFKQFIFIFYFVNFFLFLELKMLI